MGARYGLWSECDRNERFEGQSVPHRYRRALSRQFRGLLLPRRDEAAGQLQRRHPRIRRRDRLLLCGSELATHLQTVAVASAFFGRARLATRRRRVLGLVHGGRQHALLPVGRWCCHDGQRFVSRIRSRLPRTVANVSDATAISAGYRQTCALIRGGSVRCWSDVGGGQVETISGF
jgi:hypothetical protein